MSNGGQGLETNPVNLVSTRESSTKKVEDSVNEHNDIMLIDWVQDSFGSDPSEDINLATHNWTKLYLGVNHVN